MCLVEDDHHCKTKDKNILVVIVFGSESIRTSGTSSSLPIHFLSPGGGGGDSCE